MLFVSFGGLDPEVEKVLSILGSLEKGLPFACGIEKALQPLTFPGLREGI